MRLQGMSIVFALVCLPIILVIAYYLNLQIETINLQNQYNSKLLDATYDAMSAFELNTANEDLSTVSDSLRTIIEASDNIFMNALSTNFGMSNASKSHLEPFIPAILYTLYDGYYIYAPTYAPTVVTDSAGNAVYVGQIGVTISGKNQDGDILYNFEEYKEQYNEKGEVTNLLTDEQKKDKMIYYGSTNFDKKEDYGQLLYYTDSTIKGSTSDGGNTYTNCTTSIKPETAQYKTQNVLKSYMPYSARYVQDKDFKDSEGNACKADLNVIYTLDNYVTIEGSFTYDVGGSSRQIYYTKSGYLLPFTGDSLSVRFKVDGFDYDKSLEYSENEIQEYIESGRPIEVQVLKDLKDLNSWETIITIKDENKAIIDKTNTNTEADSAKLTRYENALFDLEEAINNFSLSGEEKNNAINTAKNNAVNLLNADSITISSGDAVDTILTQIRLKINDIKYRMQLNSAAVYYAKAAIFSKWVKDNLSDLQVSSIHDISGLNYSTYIDEFVRQTVGDDEYKISNMWDSDDKVFEFTNGTENRGSTEIRQDSTFYNHKIEIIRTSIQYNLNLSMSSYNRHLYYNDNQEYKYNKNTDYTMPIMKQSEWDQILNNISIVSFMQGMDCGLKQYNNYAVVSSSNNEIMTTPENIYYTDMNEFNDEASEYHKYNCKKVFNKVEKLKNDGTDIKNLEKRMSFTSKEVKYDKISTRSTVIPYRYDHKNLACYECINDGNYKGENIFESGGEEDIKSALRKAYYIGIGKERNDVYKMNAVTKSEGYEILYFDARESMINLDKYTNTKDTTSLLTMKKIKAIELVFGAVTTDRRDEASLTFKINYEGAPLKTQTGTTESLLYSIPTNTTNRYTWNVEVDSHINSLDKFTLKSLIFDLQNEDTSSFKGKDITNSIVAMRIIYK